MLYGGLLLAPLFNIDLKTLLIFFFFCNQYAESFVPNHQFDDNWGGLSY